MRILMGGPAVRVNAGDKVTVYIGGESPTPATVIKPNGIVVQVETDEPNALAIHRNNAGQLWVNDYELFAENDPKRRGVSQRAVKGEKPELRD